MEQESSAPNNHNNQQSIVNELILGRFTQDGRRATLDKASEPILWAKNPADLVSLVKELQEHHETQFNLLSDITAYDNADGKDGKEGRFVVVVQLLSTITKVRVRLKVLLKENEPMETLVNVWPAANWLEREVFDMFGIHFNGHPNLKRILMDERFTGHPLRKEYPYKLREPFADNVRIDIESQVNSKERL
jgi:NADH/F420H2 dehydrogenase subunit C